MAADDRAATVPLTLPDGALPYLLLQRAEASVFQRTARRHRAFYQRHLLRWETRLFGGLVRRRYRAWLARDYRSIRPFLPDRIRCLVDVGCGIAGIDVLLFRHYGRPRELGVHLYDRSATSGLVTYGFKGESEFYNSLELAEETLAANGVPRERVRSHEVTDTGAVRFPRADLVVSLLSWGFHYPVGTYLEAVRDALVPGGRVILDVREGSGGEDEIRDAFGDVHDLGPLENGKGRRVGALKRT